MAMMMTGRVLLVCAFCVLWCGAGGRCDEAEDTAVSGIGGESPLASKGIETSPEDTQELRRGAGGVEGNVPSTSSEDEVEEGEDDDDDKGGEDGEGKRTERQSVQEGTAAPEPGSRENNISGSDQEKNQSIAPAGDISPSGSRESNANPSQPEFEKKNDTGKNPSAVENPLTTVNGENRLPGGIAGGIPPPPPEDGVNSREQDGEDTMSEGEKNVPSPETAATPQSHRDKGSEGTGEDTKATTVTANTTDTTNTQNSDGSTAVSHTTSPLLLLLFVACAAAAAAAVAA
ncbi:Mucin-associated surface protein (MASP) [Trypanosoma cruzi]|uniref:Mucin-associated surface protein (MASP), putative n=2 Tax=Trypanosoma cruzi TaxID=5693 RepID=Q4DYV3_TRYCC|nr:mucin-associated surface protein (MASP), putative [Trypanosoma cruzi]EAN97696.1 mucin-associated surface protein (MASP), putative [Trypanosoma cruzi]KAF5219412.1 Mucin-associated surface protein (MASP) subgroup S017 [Trypanosoma cruzi]PWV19901.1 Mucin-associated surface protein (MASP) [Trypanosoma cruzi]|eukprot:XP_819547.1 mucin-associated surface protein (MASP) [Trypanosoma cruzi strain CL Brener]